MQPPDWLSLALQADQLLTQDRLADAAEHARRSLALNPDCAVAHHVLGMVAWRHGRPAEGLEHLRRAVFLRPDLPAAHNGLGLCLAQLGDHAGALREYELALILKPDHPHARFNRAMQLLRLGQYCDGWVEYEWRWASGQLTWPEIPRPKWDGRPLDGRSLLVHTEQGVGDVLMFLRFLPRVKQQPGDRLVFACQKALQPLLRNLPWVDRWFPIDEPATINFDIYMPMLSLPGGARRRGGRHPVPGAVRDAGPGAGREMAAAVAPALPGLKIGICWQGSPTFKGDQFRSIPLGQFAPLARIPGVTLVSLQKQAGEDAGCGQPRHGAGRDVSRSGRGRPVRGHGGGHAAPRSDHHVGHGDRAPGRALGRPVWVALGVDCDWRWGVDGSDSPWYPTMRLFRQTAAQDWAGVFDAMASELGRVGRGAVGDEGPTIASNGGPSPLRGSTHPTPNCPISFGELVDKITILEIKRERIADATKRANVEQELELLWAVPLPASPELTALAAELKVVNERLWDIEDDVRRCESAGDFGRRFVALARAVYKNNDERAALKRRVNDLLDSAIVEEKSYAR